MRLTSKCDGQYFNNCFPTKIYNKLGQLEDLEEELGIDLITLFKASISEVYVKFTGSYIDLRDFNFDIKNKRFIKNYYSWGFALNFKDYGKTWTLTKEELENE